MRKGASAPAHEERARQTGGRDGSEALFAVGTPWVSPLVECSETHSVWESRLRPAHDRGEFGHITQPERRCALARLHSILHSLTPACELLNALIRCAQ